MHNDETAESNFLNIADRLTESARRYPHQHAVVFPQGRDRRQRVSYTHLTFQQLDAESTRIARGLVQLGVQPGMRLVLMVRPGLEFIALTFGVFRAGATCVLIDPGMGRSNIFRCLQEVEPHGFLAIPLVHVIRLLKRGDYPSATFNVTTGWFGGWDSISYTDLLERGNSLIELPRTKSTDAAAIIFTSGSTGPPKGVVYEHGMFNAQVDLLRDFYRIQPGEVDLPGFPLFALFNSAMGVTTVIPDMDPTRPADVDPEKVMEAIEDYGVTQAFGSPALWNTVARFCVPRGIRFATLQRILSAGAPVPNHVVEGMLTSIRSLPSATNDAESEHGDIFTPYGATESLPVASMSGRDVLLHTADKTRNGAGTCIGREFPQMDVRIIPISGEPIARMRDVQEQPADEIGEICVRGPVVTREYFRRPDATKLAKIADGTTFWHRMGDVGYRDANGLLWFCGRKSHIVDTAAGRMFTIPCEAIFNNHPHVYRSALVGIGPKPQQRPVIIIEPETGHFPSGPADRARFQNELLDLCRQNTLTKNIEAILFHRSLPVDIRHNVKIFREKLVPWAESHLPAQKEFVPAPHKSPA